MFEIPAESLDCGGNVLVGHPQAAEARQITVPGLGAGGPPVGEQMGVEEAEGVVLGDGEALARLTVEENLRMGAYTISDKALVAAGIDRAYTMFPRLKERAQQLGGTLSGGEQQMLAMGRALMSSPRMLLLDEPSMGLAPNLVELIFETIVRIHAAGTSVLLVEQNAAQALGIANRGYVIQSGQVIMADDARALAANEDVRRAYLGEI